MLNLDFIVTLLDTQFLFHITWYIPIRGPRALMITLVQNITPPPHTHTHPQLPMPNPEQCNQTLGSFSLEIIFHYTKTIH